MRRVLVPLATLILGVAQIASGGCSASSEFQDGGGCEAFCTKWVGAHCRRSPRKEDCMAQCLDEQSKCRDDKNALLRCATIEANIACETGSGEPRIVGCAPRVAAVAACLGCADMCRSVVAANCPRGPSGQEECVAACVDPKCASAYSRLTDCNPGPASCSRDEVVFERCQDALAVVDSCVPGRVFHVTPPSDAGGPGPGFGGE